MNAGLLSDLLGYHKVFSRYFNSQIILKSTFDFILNSQDLSLNEDCMCCYNEIGNYYLVLNEKVLH